VRDYVVASVSRAGEHATSSVMTLELVLELRSLYRENLLVASGQ
jgi:hypothetical protein